MFNKARRIFGKFVRRNSNVVKQDAKNTNISTAMQQEEKIVRSASYAGIAFAAGIICWTAYNYMQGSRNTQNFTKTKAKILKEYDFTIVSSNLLNISRWVYVQYEFTTESGQTVTSQRVISGSPFRIVERVPWGVSTTTLELLKRKRVTVMYNPNDPHDCFIVHHACAVQNMIVALIGASIGMLFVAAKGKL